MYDFVFVPESRPFPRWLGPYSPARGTSAGFRFSDRSLGTWVRSGEYNSFWRVIDSPGSRALSALVLSEWGGGRVLFLPNGFVVKPLQEEDETGKRVLIGRFAGQMILEKPAGGIFNMQVPGFLNPGDPWPGPRTTGLECRMDSKGALACDWYHSTAYGREDIAQSLTGPDALLAKGFCKTRFGVEAGRVRVTACGHIITNRIADDGEWEPRFVGMVLRRSFGNWDKWIERR